MVMFEGKQPKIAASAFIAPGAQLIGDVQIGEDSSVWYNCVLRGDVNRICIGRRTNVQDGTVVHVDSAADGQGSGFPAIIGDEVLIGHLAMVHGCLLHDRAFVGLGAIVMDGCEIESDGMLAAGGLLTPGRRIPSGQLWAGRPAKYLRDLSGAELENARNAVDTYVALARRHAAALRDSGG